jgi:hypothetical protein
MAAVAPLIHRQASSNFPSSAQALAKYDKYIGEYIVAPVERKAVIPVVIM